MFKGTRVPIETLWNYLKAGDTLEEFLQDFPTVTKEQAIALHERAKKRMIDAWYRDTS